MRHRYLAFVAWASLFPVHARAQGHSDEPALELYRVRAPLQVGAPALQHDAVPSTISPFQVVSVAVGGGVAIAASVLGQDVDPPPCVPCDPADLPGIDRWSVRTEYAGWARASDVAVLSMVAGTWVDIARRDGGAKHLLASMEALAWTAATTQILKNGTDRLRPVMYTDDAAEAVDDAENQRSFPSGHTSTAFSLATSYFLSARKLTGESRWWIFVPAAFVGAARVAAARHFTTDVLAGAALGTLTSILVYEIRF